MKDLSKFQNRDCVVFVTGYDANVLKNRTLLSQPAHHLITQSLAEGTGKQIFGKHVFIFLINFIGWSKSEIIKYRYRHSSSQFSQNLPDFK